MKKTLSAILILAVCFTLLSSCNGDTTGGTATVVIDTETPTVYTIEFSGTDITKGLLSLLDLVDIEYDISGGFLNGVGALNPEPPTYIYIYSSLLADADVSSYATSTEYEGTTLHSVGFGAEELHIEDGAVIYISTITYSY